MAAKPKFSSTPASLIYAQSWPVPTSNSFSQRYPAKASSNSQKKSLNNSPWICKPKQNIARPQKAVSPAIHIKSHSWASSMLSNNYPGWLENDERVMLDMAKEFKITLQMFKKLTEQVKEVDEQLNSGRKAYSFKHYFSSTRSSRMRTYTPEIPMTNEEYQPCNNLGFKREQQRSPNQFGAYRKTKKSSKSKFESWPLSSNTEKTKPSNWHVQAPCDNENDNTNQSSRLQNGDLETNLSIRNESNLEYSDGDISWSSCLEFSDEDNHVGLGYIDPVPEDWEVRKLDELELEYCSEKGGSDPFMVRYLRLRRLEIETVQQEKGNGSNSNSVPCLESGVNKVTITNKGKKSAITKKQNSKINGALENFEKNPRRVLKKSSASSLHDFGEQKEGKILNKDDKDSYKETEKDRKQNQRQRSERRSECKSAKGKRRVQSCKARPVTVSYSSSVTYDILELATTFDPPGKERMKLNPRPVTAKSAKSKGMIPGKTWTSQRRFSLTAGQSVQSLPSDGGDTVISKSRTSSAKRSSKRNTKRCSSSKL